MARIRSIKPDFFTSLTVAGLTVHARLTFIGLWTHVDDEGRCVDDPRLIKAAVWPLDDRVASDVETDLKELSESSLITRYKVGERSFLTVRGWREHQRINRPTPSKLPAPPEPTPPGETPTSEPNAPHLGRKNTPITTSSVSPHAEDTEDSLAERNREQGTGNREQGVGEPRAAPRKRAPQGTRIPDDFAVTDDLKAWAQEHTPDAIVAIETAQFIDHWLAASGPNSVKKNWDAAWRLWMRNSQKWATERAGAKPGNGLALATSNGRPVGGRVSVATDRLTAAAEIAARYAAQGD